MKALLLSPKFPKSYWTYNRALELAGLKVLCPPLGLITAAALLPEDWQIRFADRNVREESEAEWRWCDLVMISAMISQHEDFHALIAKAVRLGKKVVVGGPYANSLPGDAVAAGADYVVLGEGESSIPQFLAALQRGEERGVFSSLGTPDIAASPLPRYDLLDLDAYFTMAVQTSRGCPYLCEFCEIPGFWGRQIRMKGRGQLMAELEALYQLGWRGRIFFSDDNYIGNKKRTKELLPALVNWNRARGYPFNFFTQVSLNLAEDTELLRLMGEAGFYGVFIGIETPDVASLKHTRKHQNTRHPMVEACRRINEFGMLIYAGMILGFDGEKAGAGERICRFCEEAAITQPMLGVLQALPHTPLWDRLQREGRLHPDKEGIVATGDPHTLMNFTPTRPATEIGREFIQATWHLYETKHYLARCFAQCLRLNTERRFQQRIHLPLGRALRLFPRIVWTLGIRRPGARRLFWHHLWRLFRDKPELLRTYLGLAVAGEHFLDYRQEIRVRIAEQLGCDPILTP